jgi:hypothetical protein
MKLVELEVYSEATGGAVIRPPERRFPGSLIQGDTLSVWCMLAKDIHERAEKTHDEELRCDARRLWEMLNGRQEHYAAVLREHGIGLPYGKP